MRNNSQTGTAVLLSAPGITLAKWKRKEILGTLPHAKVEIISNYKQATKLLRKYRDGYRVPKGEIHFTLVGIDKAKIDTEPYYAGVWKRIKGEKDRYGWHCPDCGELQMKEEEGEIVPLEWKDIAQGKEPTHDEIIDALENHNLNSNGLPKDFKVKWNKSRKYTKCTQHGRLVELINSGGEVNEDEIKTVCQSKMYRPALKSREETRRKPVANISRVLKQLNGKFDLYIADEVHKSKGSGSGRGDAFASMVKAAKRNLLLTGTLVNGKASSIKEILWRTDANSLLEQGFNERTGDIEWAKRYGKLEQLVSVDEEENGQITRQRKRPSQVKESPGIAPHMTAQFLLHKAAFLELGDMGLPLVELKEIPVFIDMDHDHQLNYTAFHNRMYEKCSQLSAMGIKGVWSKFTPATIMYADRPDLGAEVQIGEDIMSAEKIPGYHAKERKLVELVKSELSEDRGCVIYNSYTGSYGMDERILEVLTAHGIKAEILDEPNTDKRSEALDKLAEREVKVIITNMKKVEVGLDLLYWPTIINYQMSYEVSVFRQSNRRNWRIGQDKECRCYILAYNGTQQMAQFQTVMSGRGHAMLTEGRLDNSDLAEFSRDSQSSLATDLANCFAGGNLADAWTKLAAKDLESVEMIAEDNFKEIISQRMEALANETRRLCGMDPIEDAEFIEVDTFPSSSHSDSLWGESTGFSDEEILALFTVENVNEVNNLFDSFEVDEPAALNIFVTPEIEEDSYSFTGKVDKDQLSFELVGAM